MHDKCGSSIFILSSCSLCSNKLHKETLTYFCLSKKMHAIVDSRRLKIKIVHDLLQVDLPGLLPGEEPLDVLGSLDVWAAWV